MEEGCDEKLMIALARQPPCLRMHRDRSAVSYPNVSQTSSVSAALRDAVKVLSLPGKENSTLH